MPLRDDASAKAFYGGAGGGAAITALLVGFGTTDLARQWQPRLQTRKMAAITSTTPRTTSVHYSGGVTGVSAAPPAVAVTVIPAAEHFIYLQALESVS